MLVFPFLTISFLMQTNCHLRKALHCSVHEKSLSDLLNKVSNRFSLMLKNVNDNSSSDMHNVNVMLIRQFGNTAALRYHSHAKYLALYINGELVGISLFSAQRLHYLVTNHSSLIGLGTLLYTLTLGLNHSLNYESYRYALTFYLKLGAYRLDPDKFNIYHAGNTENVSFLIEKTLGYVNEQQLDRLRELKIEQAKLIRNRYFFQLFGPKKFHSLTTSRIIKPVEKVSSPELKRQSTNIGDSSELQFILDI
jgi:hypothetical protein